MPEVQIPKPVMVDPKLLKHHPKNVKIHDSKQLHDLGVLYDWIGFTDPIIADKDNVVWAGNGALEEALAKQMQEVPVVYMPGDWPESKKQQFMLMDNRITESEWNLENFKPLFDSIAPAMAEVFQSDFSQLVEFSTKPNPEDWNKVFDNEGEIDKDSIQITFNIPIDKADQFRAYLKQLDPNIHIALMRLYQFCQANMKL